MHIISSITSTKYTYTYSIVGIWAGRRSSEQYYIISKFLKISGWMMKNILFRRVTDDVEEFFSFVKENRIFYYLYIGLYLWRNNCVCSVVYTIYLLIHFHLCTYPPPTSLFQKSTMHEWLFPFCTYSQSVLFPQKSKNCHFAITTHFLFRKLSKDGKINPYVKPSQQST